MQIVRGRVQEIQAEGGVSAVYTVSLKLSGGGGRALRFVVTRRDFRLAPGDLVEAKIAVNPAGEEVMLLRNLSTGHILLDRVNYQAGRLSYWFLAALVLLIVLLWSFWHR